MGSISSVTERHAYRSRNRNRRVVVAECTPDTSTDEKFSLSASDVGMSSIESAAVETAIIGSSNGKVVSWDNGNNNIIVRNMSDASKNSSDISGQTITLVVTGKDE